MDGYWPGAVARYKAVIEASTRQSGLIGVSDIPIISDAGKMWGVNIDGGRRLSVSPDFDMRDSVKSMMAPAFLAEGLALAEYVLKEGLVSTLNIQMGDLAGITLKNAVNNALGVFHGY